MRFLYLAVLSLTLLGCSTTASKKTNVSIQTTHFIPVKFSELNGWSQDMHEKSFQPFVKSCSRILKRKSATNKAGDDLVKWKQVCVAAMNLSRNLGNIEKSPKRARLLTREFFESHFTPYKIGMSDHGKNLTWKARFTGYYEIELQGTRYRDPSFPHAIYMPPKDLKKHCRYFTREQINSGALRNKNLELAWVNDLPRLYFLHIQGSGVIRLKEGGELPLVNAGGNGYGFKQLPCEYQGSILHVMRKLRQNGEKGIYDMNQNKSYIFFQARKSLHPIGAQAVMLTPERSAAIDSRIYSYGIPIWVEATLPYVKGYSKGQEYHRLLIGQDRGGAIRGGGRVDIFFGRGRRAENVGGGLNSLGNMYVLFPSNIKMPNVFNLR